MVDNDWVTLRNWTGESVGHIQGRTDKVTLSVPIESNWACCSKRWGSKEAELIEGKLHIKDYKLEEEFFLPLDLASTQIKYRLSKRTMFIDYGLTEYTFKMNSGEMSEIMKLVETHRWYGQMLAQKKPKEGLENTLQVNSLPTPTPTQSSVPSIQIDKPVENLETQIVAAERIPIIESTEETSSAPPPIPTSTSSSEESSGTVRNPTIEPSKATEESSSDNSENSDQSKNDENITNEETEIVSITTTAQVPQPQPTATAQVPQPTDSSTSNRQSKSSKQSPASKKSNNSVKKAKVLKIRDRLPHKQGPIHPLTIKMIWGLVNGKSMHISYFEPLSFLQVLCEQWEYCNYIEDALLEMNPANRMAKIAGFAVSGYSSSQYRCRKPFNPRLAETYELDLWEEKGWRHVSEQVHRKPHDVTAVYVEGRSGWSISQTIELEYHGLGTILLTGRLEIIPLTTVRIKLHQFNETYEFNKVSNTFKVLCRLRQNLLNFYVHTYVHHVFNATKRCLSNSGVMHIKCNTGYSAKVTFEKGETNQKVHGNVTNPRREEMLQLAGKWNSHLYATEKAKPPMNCYAAKPLPPFYKDYFGYTKFAIQLNILQEKDKGYLPLTDSRFRPDLQLREAGLIEEAESSKTKLEQNARVQRAAGNEPQPQWFKEISKTPQHILWQFKNEYWQAKKNNFRNFNIPQLW